VAEEKELLSEIILNASAQFAEFSKTLPEKIIQGGFRQVLLEMSNLIGKVYSAACKVSLREVEKLFFDEKYLYEILEEAKISEEINKEDLFKVEREIYRSILERRKYLEEAWIYECFLWSLELFKSSIDERTFINYQRFIELCDFLIKNFTTGSNVFKTYVEGFGEIRKAIIRRGMIDYLNEYHKIEEKRGGEIYLAEAKFYNLISQIIEDIEKPVWVASYPYPETLFFLYLRKKILEEAKKHIEKFEPLSEEAKTVLEQINENIIKLEKTVDGFLALHLISHGKIEKAIEQGEKIVQKGGKERIKEKINRLVSLAVPLLKLELLKQKIYTNFVSKEELNDIATEFKKILESIKEEELSGHLSDIFFDMKMFYQYLKNFLPSKEVQEVLKELDEIEKLSENRVLQKINESLVSIEKSVKQLFNKESRIDPHKIIEELDDLILLMPWIKDEEKRENIRKHLMAAYEICRWKLSYNWLNTDLPLPYFIRAVISQHLALRNAEEIYRMLGNEEQAKICQTTAKLALQDIYFREGFNHTNHGKMWTFKSSIDRGKFLEEVLKNKENGEKIQKYVGILERDHINAIKVLNLAKNAFIKAYENAIDDAAKLALQTLAIIRDGDVLRMEAALHDLYAEIEILKQNWLKAAQEYDISKEKFNNATSKYAQAAEIAPLESIKENSANKASICDIFARINRDYREKASNKIKPPYKEINEIEKIYQQPL